MSVSSRAGGYRGSCPAESVITLTGLPWNGLEGAELAVIVSVTPGVAVRRGRTDWVWLADEGGVWCGPAGCPGLENAPMISTMANAPDWARASAPSRLPSGITDIPHRVRCAPRGRQCSHRGLFSLAGGRGGGLSRRCHACAQACTGSGEPAQFRSPANPLEALKALKCLSAFLTPLHLSSPSLDLQRGAAQDGCGAFRG